MTNPSTGEQCGCSDYTVSRRSLLRGGVALGGALAVTQMFGDSLMQATFGGTTGGNTLVVLSLRGGVDGLGVVVPHGDPGYYQARRTTAVPAASVICADAMFGLHPALAPLEKYWRSGEFAAVQATGLPVANRSHFSAIEEVEDAAPGSSLRSGWINRMIGLGSTSGSLDAVELGKNFRSTALSGDASTLATDSLKDLQLPGLGDRSTQRYSSLATAWGTDTGVLSASAREAVAISQGPGKTLAGMPKSAVVYPTDVDSAPFAEPLKSAAQLIKADLGTDVIAIDAGTWDMHVGYGTVARGAMQSNLSSFAKSLAAFLDDLGTLRQRVTLVTISEFGRRVAENGSAGFDHGWGNMMLVAGAGVKGGQYYGQWPTLDAAALAEGDLKVTTDYRNVLGEIAAKRFPDRSTAQLFPGLTYSPLGFMA
jgi:uncharacterized protein (DUF1501 family)